MITIFNRREVAVTFSMEVQAKIREVLSENNIDYYTKVINRRNKSPLSASSMFGSFGENPRLDYEYIIYVYKANYEQAKTLVRSIER